MCNLEPTVTHNSGSVPVEMEGCGNEQFKQHAMLLGPCRRKKKMPPIDIQRLMQETVLMSAQLYVGYGSLSKEKWDTQFDVVYRAS